MMGLDEASSKDLVICDSYLLRLPASSATQACDIKDPTQNIQWTVPEGGGGPGYSVM